MSSKGSKKANRKQKSSSSDEEGNSQPPQVEDTDPINDMLKQSTITEKADKPITFEAPQERKEVGTMQKPRKSVADFDYDEIRKMDTDKMTGISTQQLLMILTVRGHDQGNPTLKNGACNTLKAISFEHVPQQQQQHEREPYQQFGNNNMRGGMRGGRGGMRGGRGGRSYDGFSERAPLNYGRGFVPPDRSENRNFEDGEHPSMGGGEPFRTDRQPTFTGGMRRGGGNFRNGDF